MTPPLILVDNVFDTVRLYPSAVLAASSEVEGREAFRAADYRRDRTWWQPTAAVAGNSISVDLGAGATRAVDSLFIDRGHNLWGKTIEVYGDDGAGGSTVGTALTVPAAGTVGGDPASGTMAVTEEGALYGWVPFGPAVFRRRFLVYVLENWQPIITGLILGLRTQLLGYSATYDEDAGERTQTDQTSRAGYRGAALTYSWRTCELDLRLIGASEYDTTMRDLRRLLFERNQPAVVLMNHVAYPARGWMYQYDGGGWGMPKSRVHRGGRIRLRELGAVLP